MDRLRSVFELREMLRNLESDLGLDDLSRVERDVLLAARMLSAAPGDSVETEMIRRHTLIEPCAQATYHRALRKLLDLGFLEISNGSRTKRYVVRRDLMSK